MVMPASLHNVEIPIAAGDSLFLWTHQPPFRPLFAADFPWWRPVSSLSDTHRAAARFQRPNQIQKNQSK
jgi:hypothetical protein